MEFQENQNHHCSFCDFTSTYKSQLEVHVRTHTREKPFVCDQCQRGFTSQSYIRSHIKRVHQGLKYAQEKIYECSVCPYTTHRKLTLKIHTRMHAEKVTCQQSDVGKSVRWPQQQNNPKEKFRKECKFLCQFPNCGFRVETITRLKRHSVKHRDRRAFACDLEGCSYRAKTKSALGKHNLSMHTRRPKPFVCSTCNHHTISESLLRNHELVHLEERTVKCNFSGCAYTCKSKAALEQHARNRHKEKTFKCDFVGCSFVGAFRCKLTQHKNQVHCTYKDHKCPLCDYRAAFPSGIQAHVEMCHQASKAIPCPTKGCTYRAKHRDSLRRHLRHHKGPLECPVEGCSYVRWSSSSWERHMRLHDPVGRPFPCPLCPKRFPTNGQLSVHLRSHTREKLLKCSACNFESVHNVTMTKHVRTVHPTVASRWDETSICDHCGMNFGTGTGLAMHRVKLKTAVVVLTRLQIEVLHDDRPELISYATGETLSINSLD